MENRIRVLLVDDHEMTRGALRQLLELMPDIEVVGEASDGEEALSAVQLLSPDIVLMDLRMPGRNGLEAANQLQKDRGFTGKVIVLSMYAEFFPQAIEAGASAYLIKTAKRDEIAGAIRRAHGGEPLHGIVGEPAS